MSSPLDRAQLPLVCPELVTASQAADQSSTTSYFVSGAWLQTSVSCWSAEAAYRLSRIDEGVYALLGRGTETRHGFLRSRILALNQAVDPRLDEVWVERNGFFGGQESRFEEHLDRLLATVCSEDDWDELRIGGVTESATIAVRSVAPRHGLRVHLYAEKPYYWVDLDRIRREHGGDYLATLSPNSRQQLRRVIRTLEREIGPVRVQAAGSTEEALAWFDATAPLHRARWPNSDLSAPASGFDNPSFVAFHRRLIGTGFPAGNIRYLRIAAGDRPIAYLYNFVRRGHVQFYLSGIDYGVGERYKPGLAAHYQAIGHSLGEGDTVYDFLGGDARYKRSMCTDGGTMQWLILQRPRWQLELEEIARRMRRRLGFRKSPSGDQAVAADP